MTRSEVRRNLNKPEVDALIETAELGHATTHARFIFATVPYLGLTSSEFLHLRPSWIYWRDADAFESDANVEIHIPTHDTCRNLKWDHSPPNYIEKPGSCRQCRSSGPTDEFDLHGRDHHKSDNPGMELGRERVVPVRSERAERELRRWFQTHERPGIPWSQTRLADVIRKVAERSPVTGDIGYRTLRRTFVHILAESGVSKSNILKYTPNNHFYYRGGDTARAILEDSSTDYDWRIQAIDRLRTINRVGPATVRELSDIHGVNTGTEYTVLKNLCDKGWVECFGKGEVKHGPAPDLYDVDVDFNLSEGIPCPCKNCGSTFLSTGGRDKHLDKVHQSCSDE